MELNEFLVKAKVNTYAGGGEIRESVLADGGKELVYRDGGWEYRDRYFGFDPFIGEEIVWRDGKAVWGMNYRGRVISGGSDCGKIYEFLKKALKQVPLENPFRGPQRFQENEWDYRNHACGFIDNFEGAEYINFCGKRVYELIYHGGSIDK